MFRQGKGLVSVIPHHSGGGSNLRHKIIRADDLEIMKTALSVGTSIRSFITLLISAPQSAYAYLNRPFLLLIRYRFCCLVFSTIFFLLVVKPS